MKKFLFLTGSYCVAALLYWGWLHMEHEIRDRTTIEQVWSVVAWLALGPISNLEIIRYFPWEFIVESLLVIGLLYIICVHRVRLLWYGFGVVWFYSAIQYGIYVSQMG